MGNIDLINKRIEHFYQLCDNHEAKAKIELKKKNVAGAKSQLGYKKYYEEEATKLEKQRFRMETEVNALQSSAFNMKLFDNIRKGRDAMKVTRGDLDMEQVDKIMEDLEDEKE